MCHGSSAAGTLRNKATVTQTGFSDFCSVSSALHSGTNEVISSYRVYKDHPCSNIDLLALHTRDRGQKGAIEVEVQFVEICLLSFSDLILILVSLNHGF